MKRPRPTLLDLSALGTLALGLAVLIFTASPAPAAPSAPRPPQRPTDIGGCCYGSGQSDATSTRGDCADRTQSPTGRPGLFVLGTFPDTDDENAFCNILPGGD